VLKDLVDFSDVLPTFAEVAGGAPKRLGAVRDKLNPAGGKTISDEQEAAEKSRAQKQRQGAKKQGQRRPNRRAPKS